jgi:hypothetical protein
MNETKRIFLEELEREFGDIYDDSGCYLYQENENGEKVWLSVDSVRRFILRVLTEYDFE